MPKTKSRKAKPPTATKRVTSAAPLIRATLGPSPRQVWQSGDQARVHPRELLKRYGRLVLRCIELNSQTAAAVCPKLFVMGNKDVVEKCAALKPKKLDARTKAFLKGNLALQPGLVARKYLRGNIDDMTEVTQHEALMLLDDVNPWDEGFSFRQSWYADLDLFGKFFTQLVVEMNDVPVELWRMQPHITDVVPSPTDFIDSFMYGRELPKRRFAPDEVFWVKNFDPDNPWGGYGWVEGWLKSIDADYTMAAFNQWLFNRGGTPDYVLLSKGKMTPDQKRVYRTEWRRMFGDLNRRQESLAIHEGEGEIVKLSQTPREMEYSNSRKDMRDEICNAAGVPKSLITSDDVNRANAAEGNPQYIRGKIWPMVQRVEDAINQRLLPRWSDRLLLIHDNPLKEDEVIRIQRDEADLRMGMTPNELLERRGEETKDDPGMNTRYIGSDLIPMSMAGQTVGPDGLMAGMGGYAVPPDTSNSESSDVSPDVETTQPATPPTTTAADTTTLPPVPLDAGLQLLTAYYGHEIPREAAIILAQTSLRMTPQQANVFVPEVAPDAPMSQVDQQNHEANLALQNARASGNMPANGGANGNFGKAQDSTRRANGGVGVTTGWTDENDSPRWTFQPLQGAATHGLGGPASVLETPGRNRSGHDDRPDGGSLDEEEHRHEDAGRGIQDSESPLARGRSSSSGYGAGDAADSKASSRTADVERACSATSELHKAWEGIEHGDSIWHIDVHYDAVGLATDAKVRRGCELGQAEGSATDNNIISKCWAAHCKDTTPQGRGESQEGLPDSGSPRGFAQNMNGILQAQIAAMLAAMHRHGNVPTKAVQDALRVISEPQWVERISEAAKPFLGRAIEIGGKFGMEKLGPDVAIGFDVTNPEVQKFIDNYSVRLANGVNEYTHVSARDLLGDGLQEGESIPELTERVKDWAGEVGDTARGTGARAENIARTESARAYVKGEEEAWKQSGVVEGKQWLLAADACPFCEAAAKLFESKTLRLGQSFFDKGHVLQDAEGRSMTLDYSDVDGPPLHPQCRCDLIPVLIEEPT